MQNPFPAPAGPRRREPIFNVPGALLALIATLAVLHGLRTLMPVRMEVEALYALGFVPARYGLAAPEMGIGSLLDAGAITATANFVTYTFLHGDLTHLALNCLWLAAFGAPVIRRLGTDRFLALYFLCGAAGAGLHLLLHAASVAPLIGASASISGMMGAAARFALAPAPLGYPRERLPLRRLTDSRVLVFVGLWFGLNWLFGTGAASVVGGGAIAWEAHIGGFVAGLLLMPLFDRAR
ncbi:MAG: rhomboid family intramembrane serine protease [Alphaproteobacteria bacterium]|nr:rhomboid family intramembrane serine protease [Alphaproteobacteria bacterium]MDX5369321.1 rhomboid family intramembrane serine protease [Alphaproteobacteria bacterium]MDX5464006.1 rhomboid family intramembrane serine protease [Alphaproteobacteria bacterium]